MSDIPELAKSEKDKEKKRRGFGAFWSSPGSTAASSPWRAAVERATSFLREIPGGIMAPNGPIGFFVKQLPSLGWKGAFAVLKVPIAKMAGIALFSYFMANVLSFGIARMNPYKPKLSKGKAGTFASPPAVKPSGSDWLPSDGLFGLLPGVFTRSKGFRKDGSPAPDASMLKGGEGGEAGAGAEGGVGAEAGEGAAAQGKNPEDVARWAEALAGARGGSGAASARLERMEGMGSSSFSSGALGGPGAKGGARPPKGGKPVPGGAVASGRLTAFRRGASKRAVTQGNRIARALPPSINVRQALLGTQIVSNAAARISGNEAAAVHAGAPFDSGGVGAQVIGDPVGLRGGGGGTGPRPGQSGRNGGLPFNVRAGNPNILRPDLGDLVDRYPDDPDRDDSVFRVSTYTVNPNADATIFIQLVERARALTTQAKDNYNSGTAKIAAGGGIVAGGYAALQVPLCLAACQAAAWVAIGIGTAMIIEGWSDLGRSNDQANEALGVADEIESNYGQTAGAEAIDYCVEQAREGKQCVFRGNDTRSRQCGYKPKMNSDELRLYALCMAERGGGLNAQQSFYPDGRPDPADPDRICSSVYPDAVLRQTGDPARPTICVRAGNAPPP